MNPKLIVTTSWDDGCVYDLKVANLLNKYNLKGTFYVSKNFFIETMSNDELKIIDKTHEIGAHTLNHCELTNVPLSYASDEIYGSKKYLENILNHNVDIFAYPKGLYNLNIIKLVKSCGFKAARSVIVQGFDFPTDPYNFGVTLLASNKSPLFALKTCIKLKNYNFSLIDWEDRAKNFFDLALLNGGIYHFFCHSWTIEKDNEWSKLERVFQYISNRSGVKYVTNGELFK